MHRRRGHLGQVGVQGQILSGILGEGAQQQGQQRGRDHQGRSTGRAPARAIASCPSGTVDSKVWGAQGSQRRRAASRAAASSDVRRSSSTWGQSVPRWPTGRGPGPRPGWPGPQSGAGGPAGRRRGRAPGPRGPPGPPRPAAAAATGGGAAVQIPPAPAEAEHEEAAALALPHPGLGPVHPAPPAEHRLEFRGRVLGEHAAEQLQGDSVGVAGRGRGPDQVQGGRPGGPGVHPRAGLQLDNGLADFILVGRGEGRQGAQPRLDGCQGSSGVHIAHQDEDPPRGPMVAGVEGLQGFWAGRVQGRRVAHHRRPVGMARGKGSRQQGVHAVAIRGVGGDVGLAGHHIALAGQRWAVDARQGGQPAAGLQLQQAVQARSGGRRQKGRAVVVGPGVGAAAQGFQAAVIGPTRPFKGEVFEEVGEAGFARPFGGSAPLGHQQQVHDRRAVIGLNHHGEPVGQRGLGRLQAQARRGGGAGRGRAGSLDP